MQLLQEADMRRPWFTKDKVLKKGGPQIQDHAMAGQALINSPEYKEALKRPSTIVKRKTHHPRPKKRRRK